MKLICMNFILVSVYSGCIFICVRYCGYWAIITFFLIIPYGVMQENMSRPNILIKTLEENMV